MLREAVMQGGSPAALCYPRGGEGDYRSGWSGQAADVLREGSELTLVTHGVSVNDALAAVDALRESGISVELIKLNTLRPLGTETVLSSLKKTERFMSLEECCRAGSAGTQLMAAAAAAGLSIRAARQLDLGSGVVSHGSVSDLRRDLGMDAAGIINAVKEILHEKSKA